MSSSLNSTNLELDGHLKKTTTKKAGIYRYTTTELYYITGGSARRKKVKPKTWRIFAFADAISMTTGPKISEELPLTRLISDRRTLFTPP